MKSPSIKRTFFHFVIIGLLLLFALSFPPFIEAHNPNNPQPNNPGHVNNPGHRGNTMPSPSPSPGPTPTVPIPTAPGGSIGSAIGPGANVDPAVNATTQEIQSQLPGSVEQIQTPEGNKSVVKFDDDGIVNVSTEDEEIIKDKNPLTKKKANKILDKAINTKGVEAEKVKVKDGAIVLEKRQAKLEKEKDKADKKVAKTKDKPEKPIKVKKKDKTDVPVGGGTETETDTEVATGNDGTTVGSGGSNETTPVGTGGGGGTETGTETEVATGNDGTTVGSGGSNETTPVGTGGGGGTETGTDTEVATGNDGTTVGTGGSNETPVGTGNGGTQTGTETEVATGNDGTSVGTGGSSETPVTPGNTDVTQQIDVGVGPEPGNTGAGTQTDTTVITDSGAGNQTSTEIAVGDNTASAGVSNNLNAGPLPLPADLSNISVNENLALGEPNFANINLLSPTDEFASAESAESDLVNACPVLKNRDASNDGTALSCSVSRLKGKGECGCQLGNLISIN